MKLIPLQINIIRKKINGQRNKQYMYLETANTRHKSIFYWSPCINYKGDVWKLLSPWLCNWLYSFMLAIIICCSCMQKSYFVKVGHKGTMPANVDAAATTLALHLNSCSIFIYIVYINSFRYVCVIYLIILKLEFMKVISIFYPGWLHLLVKSLWY